MKITPSERLRKWRLDNPEKYREQGRRRRSRGNPLTVKDNQLRTKYGISLADYEKMLADQGGGCAACGGQNANGWRLALDHCHDTGIIRGILCSACNSVLGLLQEREERFEKLVAYMRKFPKN